MGEARPVEDRVPSKLPHPAALESEHGGAAYSPAAVYEPVHLHGKVSVVQPDRVVDHLVLSSGSSSVFRPPSKD